MKTADVLVVGGGLAGISTALACARRGRTVSLVDSDQRGAASRASAGVLGPSIGRGPKGGRVGRFMFAARDRFPAFLAGLREATGSDVPMVHGALELALNETHFAELRARVTALPDAEVLGASDVGALEPALAAVAGALHHPRDGAVDVRALRAALDQAIRLNPRITVIRVGATSVNAAGSEVSLTDGTRAAASHVVIACGAWVSELRGLPRSLPVRPVKGEVAVAADHVPLRQVVFGAGGYLVPRGSKLLVGATSEEAGFSPDPSAAAAAVLATTVRTLLRDWPADAAFAGQEAGLRPMTPDGYPILGPDPEVPTLLYACGYSRNGVLVSPLAADCLAAMIDGDDPGFDLSVFTAARFGG